MEKEDEDKTPMQIISLLMDINMKLDHIIESHWDSFHFYTGSDGKFQQPDMDSYVLYSEYLTF